MINKIVILICTILCSITAIYINKIILSKENENNSKKNILLCIFIVVVTYFLYGMKYRIESNIFKIISFIIIIKLMYKESIYKTIISNLITFSIIYFFDFLNSIVWLNFITANYMRSTWYIILICNFIVCALSNLFIKIPVIKDKLRKFITNLHEDTKSSTVFLLFLSTFIIIYTFYNISVNYHWSEKYIINVIIAASYFIIIIIFLKDQIVYHNLILKYDSLFEYFEEIENSIDEISLINHEYKNQLAVLKGYIEHNKKQDALKYVDDIINNINIEDKQILSELKNIPKGGIKGLLYYKIISAKNRNVEIVLDVGENIINDVKKFSTEENKIISKVLGVYIDNAIEAVAPLKKKVVTIEIYIIDNDINIVISNEYKKNSVNISKISKKGYSTKGNGRGKGLYLINKLTNKFQWLHTERKIINKFYVQKIIINKNFTNN